MKRKACTLFEECETVYSHDPVDREDIDSSFSQWMFGRLPINFNQCGRKIELGLDSSKEDA